jgi:hypothetical protein
MSKPAGKCVFCGGPGLTKGHVWPDWLGKVLPQTATHHEHETGRFETFTPSIPGPEHSTRIHQGQARSRKPRNTCKKCNSGWMSRIEELAIPFMVPLIRGERMLLSPFGQLAVSALICLIGMRLEFLGVQRAVSQTDRDWLREHRWPSSDWKIWIARYAGEKSQDHFAKYYAAQLGSVPPERVGPEHCNVRVATLVIGQLCTHSFYSPVDTIDGYDGTRISRVWPPVNNEIETGLTGRLSDKAVLWLHEAFARESPPDPTYGNHKDPPSSEGDHTQD